MFARLGAWDVYNLSEREPFEPYQKKPRELRGDGMLKMGLQNVVLISCLFNRITVLPGLPLQCCVATCRLVSSL